MIRLRTGTLMALLCAAACSGSTTKPTPTPDAPKITCPAAQTQASRDGQAVSVTYPPPAVIGGATPVAMTCSPTSPSTFPIGSTNVTCSAVDALSRTDACSFAVIVTAPPRIGATRFVAFGDSISHGVLGLAPKAVGDPGPPVGYPFKLRTLLANRYTAQTISMTDEGLPAESVTMGVTRLPGVLTRDQPEVLLLLEGVNDLNGGRDAAIPTVKAGLTTMVREARGRGMAVFLATLLPERPPGQRTGGAASIPPANAEIRAVAAREGATLVDLFTAFDGQTGTLLGPDGLHPNDAGYQKMAEVFFDAIRGRLELRTSNLELGIGNLEFGTNVEWSNGSRIPNSEFRIPNFAGPPPRR
jgi:lysophospholipase L1-like esterase